MTLASNKGKAKAEDFEMTDLNPVITYRHVLQQNLGVRDPLRVVALCDSDAFFAACEMVRLGVTDKPLIVLQWEGIIAVNYPARKFGITRFQKLEEAKKCCPDLMIVHVATYKEGEAEPGYWDNIDSRTHKVSLDYYRRESVKILNMFKEGLPGAEIEKASIDEAFIDFTKPVRQALLQRYPYLAQVPPDAPSGLDTPIPAPPSVDWTSDSHLIPIHPDSETANQDLKTDPPTWHDIALHIAAEMMHKVRVDIANKLGYTTSAGIARNKFLAKLSASYRKPYSQTVLRNLAIPCYLRPLEFQKIRFLGGKLGEALVKEYDVSTVADLLPISLEELQEKFGESAVWIYEILRGIDRAEVKEKPPVNKSMMAAKALHRPITQVSDGPHWIRVLSGELALRLNDARKERPSLWPKTLTIHGGSRSNTANGWSSRSKQAPFPFIKEVTIDVIAAAGEKLWRELVGTGTGPIKINHIALAFTGIEAADDNQQSIDSFFANPSGLKRLREEEHDFSQTRPESPTRPRQCSPPSGQGPTSFTCPQCHKTFSLPPKTLSLIVDAEDRAQALEALKNEHDDFHFAQSVAREVEPEVKIDGADRTRVKPSSKTNAKPSSSKKPKKGHESEGIEKFFSRK
ncbi:hypothetical protein GYMLUDRAFT_223745 [Collybiopsis luxurians FD-317 M1]|uniref:DNA polymerase eta n=1 Tax=Collybiopsis luxurians FD-317 M1 TaxID=944289 RepID=A0A0D0CT31_9AGAR|nr:hypothetical protein GYMLUDRAFT_223745 [Collybiopsis luxurians FD-317 M1]